MAKKTERTRSMVGMPLSLQKALIGLGFKWGTAGYPLATLEYGPLAVHPKMEEIKGYMVCLYQRKSFTQPSYVLKKGSDYATDKQKTVFKRVLKGFEPYNHFGYDISAFVPANKIPSLIKSFLKETARMTPSTTFRP